MENLPNRYSVDLNNLVKKQKLGEGGFGTVYLVEEKETGKKYAAKVSRKIINDDDDEDDAKKMINREIGLMIRTQHLTIIKFYGYSLIDFKGKNRVTLLMQYAENGSLAAYLNKAKRGLADPSYDNTAKQKILVGVARAMMYLHKHYLIHRDLKPDNVLLDDNLEPHVADFGTSKFSPPGKSSNQTQYIGTPQYMAPEVIDGGKYNGKADVYSFGILMYEVITQLAPFDDYVKGKITAFQLHKQVLEGLRPQFKVPIKESLQSLIEKCWSQEPRERPTFEEIFNRLAFNKEDSVYDNFDDDEKTPKYYLDGVDQNRLLFYVDTINDDNSSYRVDIDELKQQLKDLKTRVAQLEESNQQKDEVISSLNRRLQNTKIYTESVFEYDHTKPNTFDGIIQHLTVVIGGNVDEKGVVKVSMPSVFEGKDGTRYLAKYAVNINDQTNYAQSDNTQNSYLRYDFIDRKVLPTHYSIRSRHDGTYGPTNNHLQNWVIEGSNTGLENDWTILDKRDNIKSLDDINAFQTFEIQCKFESEIGFRFLQIRQIGYNTTNRSYHLTISALEYFGSLFELK